MAAYLQSLDNARILVLLVVILLGLGGLLLPLLRYLRAGWEAKSKDIMDGLDAGARIAYFGMFNRTARVPDEKTAVAAFNAFYTRWYGRRYFIAPGILFASVSVVVTTTLAVGGLHVMHVLPMPSSVVVPATAMAALAGAYLWVANDLISRARRLDFSPADVLWASLRLIISIPMGYAFARIAAPSLAPLIAFGLGTFPLGSLTSTLSKITTKALNQDAATAAAKSDLLKLQGLNDTILERLADEDITTVTQMAYCDPVRLTMRSNLSFNYVTDCMGQALAWLYFEDQIATLRCMGLRGACEIKSLIDDYDAVDLADIDVAHASALAHLAMSTVANKLGQDEATLQFCFRQISADPFTQFLTEVWTDARPAEEDPGGARTA